MNVGDLEASEAARTPASALSGSSAHADLEAEFVAHVQDIERCYHLMDKPARIRVEQWVRKLGDVMPNPYWKKNRNRYIALLSFQVRRGRLDEPFHKLPYGGPLQTMPVHMLADVHREMREQRRMVASMHRGTTPHSEPAASPSATGARRTHGLSNSLSAVTSSAAARYQSSAAAAAAASASSSSAATGQRQQQQQQQQQLSASQPVRSLAESASADLVERLADAESRAEMAQHSATQLSLYVNELERKLSAAHEDLAAVRADLGVTEDALRTLSEQHAAECDNLRAQHHFELQRVRSELEGRLSALERQLRGAAPPPPQVHAESAQPAPSTAANAVDAGAAEAAAGDDEGDEFLQYLTEYQLRS